MEYFVTLAVATAIIVLLGSVLYRRSEDLGLVAGLGALYYWSLYGAWFIVIDKSGGDSGQHYQYLEGKLFPIVLDQNYLAAIMVYSGFLIAVELTLLVVLRRRVPKPVPPLVLRHEPILLIGLLAGIGSYLIIRERVSIAWDMNTSAYWYTRAQTGDWFTLHQVLNRVALIPPALGMAVLAAGRRSRFFVNAAPRYIWPGYILLAVAMGTLTFVLGNKNEVFAALLAGLLAYWGLSVRPKIWKGVAIALCGLWFLAAIDFFRSTPVAGIADAVTRNFEESTGVAHFVASSNEAFGAHFSMYGALTAQVEPRFGYSIYSLVCSLVPRVFWKDRPRDIYLYYSESVGAVQNQGYSLHHATGWYLNFGYPGVALGGVVLGMAWGYCINARHRLRPSSGLLTRLFAIIAPWVFVAGLPPLVRAGPEAYKGLFLESFLIPLLIFGLACRPKRRLKTGCKLLWHPETGWRFAEAARR